MGQQSRRKKSPSPRRAQKAAAKGKPPAPAPGKPVWSARHDIAKLMEFQEVVAAAPGAPTAEEVALREDLRRDVAKYGLGEVPPSLLDSPEEEAAYQARANAQRLVKTDMRVRQTVAAMMAFRQCYAVAYRELQAAMAKYDNLHELTEDYLVQAAMHQAARPFNEHQLMQGFVQTVLPWIAETVDSHTAADDKQAARDEKAEAARRAAEEAARKARPVPIGFPLDLASSAPEVSREPALIFAGRADAVLFVLDQVMSAALAAREGQTFCVVRCCAQAPRSRDESRQLIRLPPDAWQGCCNKGKGVARMMGRHVAERLTQPVDVLMIDELSLAKSSLFAGQPSPALAGAAHRDLNRWCREAGALLVAGVEVAPPGAAHVPDLSGPAFEQLRALGRLRAVIALDDLHEDGKVVVTVAGGLHKWHVDKAVLESYNRGTIVLPPGAST